MKDTFICFVMAMMILCLAECTYLLNRGYGIKGNLDKYRAHPPAFYAKSYLTEISDHSIDHWQQIEIAHRKKLKDFWLSPRNIEAISNRILLNETEQPYADMNIWVFDTKMKVAHPFSKNIQLLYGPFDGKDTAKGKNYRTIVGCTKAAYQSDDEIYHPYQRLPEKVINEFNGEKWVTLDSSKDCTEVTSNLPPVPGAIIVKETPDTPAHFLYPAKTLPTLKTIYPNAKIPTYAIIK